MSKPNGNKLNYIMTSQEYIDPLWYINLLISQVN